MECTLFNVNETLPRMSWWRLENQSLMKERINQDNATNSRELTFARIQQKCKHGKSISNLNIWLWVVYR
jgi:hypothetical protein